MINKIKIINDFLSEDELNELQKHFEDNIKWVFGSQSDRDSPPFGHWNHDFLETAPHNQEDFEPMFMKKSGQDPIQKLWVKLKSNLLQGHQLVRCYANAYTYGVDGYPHADSRMKNNFTTMIYLNPQWLPEWAGETIFLNENADVVKASLPKPGRIISFDGRITHAGRSVSRRCPSLRVVLLFKSLLPSSTNHSIPEKYKLFLLQSGTDKLEHSSYTLMEHLKNTYNILKNSGAKKEVCLAGLFHSIYGTIHYKKNAIQKKDRQIIINLLGIETEQLVWKFCNLDRPNIFENVLSKSITKKWLNSFNLSKDEFDALVQIECANLLEQKGLHKFPNLTEKAKCLNLIDTDYLPN